MGKLLKVVIPVLIIALAVGAGYWLIANPEQAKKRPRPEAQALLVETGMPESGEHHAQVEAMGQVVPALEASLKSQVSGEIVDVADDFVPGGYFEKGDFVLRIDPADYLLTVQKQEAILKQAQADYALEQGRQEIARDELDILARTTGRKLEDTSLALRGPQLEQAQAELAKARSDLEAARLDLKRTEIRAPFNALVIAREATLGDKVSASETLATLVNVDKYWVELSVPVNDLRWLSVPKTGAVQGSPAHILLDGGRGQATGYLERLTGSLDPNSRLAGLLVAVPDPLGMEDGNAESPLILNDYVTVVLEGKALGDAVRVPLSWVRDNATVWVNEDGRLAFRKVDIVYEDKHFAYIAAGLGKGDMVVTSSIAVPVEGMKLRTMAQARSDVQEKMKGPLGPNGEPNSDLKGMKNE